MSLRSTFLAVAAAMTVTSVAPAVRAQSTTVAASVSPDARTVLQHMVERNPSLQSYKARVHVDVRMLSFPYFAPKLDGTSYYKRPDTYEVVFDRVPSYAKGFQKLFDDIGDAAAWERDQKITLDGVQMLNGHPTYVLRLTKRIHSDILDHTLAYVDQASFALMRMEWYYTSGGKITMSQQYVRQGQYWVPSAQHADIQIPHVHAVADASYDAYQTNVAVAPEATP
jgi:outer membrane lipoprotein-sorting protein